MERKLPAREGNVFKGVGYGLALSGGIVAFWVLALSALF